VGKISKALNKYIRERSESTQTPQLPRMALNQADYDSLVNYDRETGHLIKYDRGNGHVDGHSIEQLREQGTIQRLLDNELIYPGGKLTPRGVDEADRLERMKIAETKPDLQPPAEPAVKQPTEAKLRQVTILDAEGGFGGLSDALTTQVSLEEGLREEPSYEDTVLEPARPPLKLTPVVVPARAEKLQETPDGRNLTAKTGLGKVLPIAGEPVPAVTYDEKVLDPYLVALNAPHSHEAEQFKILRTNILYPVAGDPPRSILLTSTGPEEGKSFAAANLAISIALNVNRHVLLIDADLRNPQLHHRFGFGEVPGLSNYLADGIPLPSLLLKTKVEKLTLLPSGLPPANPSELISSERMENLLAEVSARYSDRLIVIDAPPPSLAAETGVLTRQVDGVLIVVRYGRTRMEDLADLIEGIGRKKILGTLVNFIETADSRYYGYKYGGYRKGRNKGHLKSKPQSN
jgi:protein-tyrosine kinase